MGKKWSDHQPQQIEADFGFGPVQIYFRPMNVLQRKLIAAALDKSLTDYGVESLMLMARDSTGMQIWKSAQDRAQIETEFDPDELDRVVGLLHGGKADSGN